MWVLIQTRTGQLLVVTLRESTSAAYKSARTLRSFPTQALAEAELARRQATGGRTSLTSGGSLGDDTQAFKAKVEGREAAEIVEHARNANDPVAERDSGINTDGEHVVSDRVAERDQTDKAAPSQAADIEEVAKAIRGGADQPRPVTQEGRTTGAAAEVEAVWREASVNEALFAEATAITGAAADSVSSAAPAPASRTTPSGPTIEALKGLPVVSKQFGAGQITEVSGRDVQITYEGEAEPRWVPAKSLGDARQFPRDKKQPLLEANRSLFGQLKTLRGSDAAAPVLPQAPRPGEIPSWTPTRIRPGSALREEGSGKTGTTPSRFPTRSPDPGRPNVAPSFETPARTEVAGLGRSTGEGAVRVAGIGHGAASWLGTGKSFQPKLMAAGVEQLKTYLTEQAKVSGGLHLMTGTRAGFEMMLAIAAIQARDAGAPIRITAVEPHEGFVDDLTVSKRATPGFVEQARSYQAKILAAADEVHYLHERAHADTSTATLFNQRTAYMVGQSRTALVGDVGSNDTTRTAIGVARGSGVGVVNVGESVQAGTAVARRTLEVNPGASRTEVAQAGGRVPVVGHEDVRTAPIAAPAGTPDRPAVRIQRDVFANERDAREFSRYMEGTVAAEPGGRFSVTRREQPTANSWAAEGWGPQAAPPPAARTAPAAAHVPPVPAPVVSAAPVAPAPNPEQARTVSAPNVDRVEAPVSKIMGPSGLSETSVTDSKGRTRNAEQLGKLVEKNEKQALARYEGQDSKWNTWTQEHLEKGTFTGRFVPKGVTIPAGAMLPEGVRVHPEAVDLRPTSSRTPVVPVLAPVPVVPVPAVVERTALAPANEGPVAVTPPSQAGVEPPPPAPETPRPVATPTSRTEITPVRPELPTLAAPEAPAPAVVPRPTPLTSGTPSRALGEHFVPEPPSDYMTHDEIARERSAGAAEEHAARISEQHTQAQAEWLNQPSSRTGTSREVPPDYESELDRRAARTAALSGEEEQLARLRTREKAEWDNLVERSVTPTRTNVAEPSADYDEMVKQRALRDEESWVNTQAKAVNDRTGKPVGRNTVYSMLALESARQGPLPEPTHEYRGDHHDPKVEHYNTEMRRFDHAQGTQLARRARGVGLENFSRTLVGATPLKSIVYNPVGQAFIGMFLQGLIAPQAFNGFSATPQSRVQLAAEGTLWAAVSAHPLLAGAMIRSHANRRDINEAVSTFYGLTASVVGAHTLGAASAAVGRRVAGPHTGRVAGALGSITGWMLMGVAHNLGLFEMFRETAQRQLGRGHHQPLPGHAVDGQIDAQSREAQTGTILAQSAAAEFEAIFLNEDGDELDFDGEFEGTDFEDLTDDNDEALPYEMTSIREPSAGF